MKVYAPGKLILSGEHSVVHGAPALAMAVNRYAVATVSHEHLPQILFELADLAHRSHLSFSGLVELKNRIKEKYHRFIRGEYTIKQVLHKPFELAQVAIGVITEAMNVSLPHGVKIHVQSDIPIGCGMGSSAATIVSVMQAVSHYLKMPMQQDELYRFALETENMQHGQSSGLDLQLSMRGGCVYMHEQRLEARPVPAFPLYFVNTGAPLSSTGECVNHTSQILRMDTTLLNEFANVTNAMDAALQRQSQSAMQVVVRNNHRLLTQVGVVPEKVQQFIADIENEAGAAKICGAGSIDGDHGGMVMVLIDDTYPLQALVDQFGFTLLPVAGESRGVYVA